LAAVATRAAAGLTKRPGIRAYSLPTACHAISSHGDPAPGWQVREEQGEYDIPDPMEDEHFEPDRELFHAANAYTEEQREAMALLDEAENLLAVLMAAVENDADSRAAQVEAVLNVARKKLSKAHVRIDRQDGRHRDLFLAYFALKAQSDQQAE
jgi:multidrug resistance efflux pump